MAPCCFYLPGTPRIVKFASDQVPYGFLVKTNTCGQVEWPADECFTYGMVMANFPSEPENDRIHSI